MRKLGGLRFGGKIRTSKKRGEEKRYIRPGIYRNPVFRIGRGEICMEFTIDFFLYWSSIKVINLPWKNNIYLFFDKLLDN